MEVVANGAHGGENKPKANRQSMSDMGMLRQESYSATPCKEKAGGVAASAVGQRRSIRTPAEPPGIAAGGRISQNLLRKGEKNKSLKPSFGDCVYGLAMFLS
jgi:hypothetical protein